MALVAHRRPNGFTLIETLVALTVLGLLFAAFTQGVHFGLLAWATEARLTDGNDDFDTLDNTLRHLIEVADPGDDAEQAPFAATSDRLDCVTALPNGYGAMPGRRIRATLLVDAGHRLLLRWQPSARTTPLRGPPEPIETELLRGVSRIELSFWRPGGAWVGAWRSPDLPTLVRVRLHFPSGDPRIWPDIVAAPGTGPAIMRGAARQRGFALLVVLWTLSLLALLGTHLLAASRQDTQLARNLLDGAVLEAAANGAVQQAMFGVLDGYSRHGPLDQGVRTVRVGRTIVAVRVEDEADKVNPNIASPKLLRALLLQVGADAGTAATVAASIVEWRLSGGTAARPNPAVARYAAAGLDYAPSGAPFGSPDELGGVLGMTADLMARLRPHLTVYTDGDPTLATQDPVVALALAAAGQRGVESDEGGSGLMSVTADARGPGQARLTLHVTARINGQPEGPRYEILAYERLSDDQP